MTRTIGENRVKSGKYSLYGKPESMHCLAALYSTTTHIDTVPDYPCGKIGKYP